MLLDLFLGFGQRRFWLSSLAVAADRSRNHDAYSSPVIDRLIGIVARGAVAARAFHTFDAAAVPSNHAKIVAIGDRHSRDLTLPLLDPPSQPRRKPRRAPLLRPVRQAVPLSRDHDLGTRQRRRPVPRILAATAGRTNEPYAVVQLLLGRRRRGNLPMSYTGRSKLAPHNV